MSRDEIIEEIRAVLPEPTELPNLSDLGIRFEDKAATFATMLEAVGGVPEVVSSIEQIGENLETQFGGLDRWLSFFAGIDSKGMRVDEARDGHDYRHVDLVLLEGAFGVAENGAIWVPNDCVNHPASLVLTQHLAIVIRSSELVDNMHQAYARIRGAGDLPSYGVFVSGPSKTADIEQSLVLGAHGARSLVVFMLP